MVWILSGGGCPSIVLGYDLPNHNEDITSEGLDKIVEVSSKVKRGFDSVRKEFPDYLIRICYGIYANDSIGVGFSACPIVIEPITLEAYFHHHVPTNKAQEDPLMTNLAVDIFIKNAGVPDYARGLYSNSDMEFLNKLIEKYGKKLEGRCLTHDRIIDIQTKKAAA